MCEWCRIRGETCPDCEAKEEGFENYRDMLESLGVD